MNVTIRRTLVWSLLGAASMIALLLASSASAHQLTPYGFSSSFNGADSTVGEFSASMGGVAIDQATGQVYVVDTAVNTQQTGADDWVSRFTASGVAAPFSGLGGASSLDTDNLSGGNGYDIAVDNSADPKGFYVLNSSNAAIRAYTFAGLPRPGFPILRTNEAALEVDPEGFVWVDNAKYSSDGPFINDGFFPAGEITDTTIDSQSNFYVSRFNGVYKYNPQGDFLFLVANGYTNAVAVDLSNDHVFVLRYGGEITEYTPDGVPLSTFTPTASAETGIAVNRNTHDVYVSGARRVQIFSPQPPITVPDATTESADPNPASAVLHAVVNADGVPTTDCKFEWGSSSYGNSTSCDQGSVYTGSADNSVTATVSLLTLGQTYHYRIAVKNANLANGKPIYSYGLDRTFQAQGPPSSGGEFVSEVNTDGARLHATVHPNGGDTRYQFQYTTQADFEANDFTNALSVPPAPGQTLASNMGTQNVSRVIAGLSPDTRYVYRVVPTNANSSIPGDPHAFKTFPLNPPDLCFNAQVRQQTEASLLFDCRAYELVTASYTGGYDVASDLAPGQAPLAARPRPTDRLLYTVNFGAIPGVPGNPTNYGSDPYLATRNEAAKRWDTAYVGLPADGMSDPGAFGSPLLGSDSGLRAFAFGGPGICAPCFADGSTNVPLRLADGTLVKGMAGTLNPAANPAGGIAQPFSADGSHFVFSSDQSFESGPFSVGEVLIYDRNLKIAKTQVVSTLPDGTAIPGGVPGSGKVAELDISSQGSRIVIGDKTGADPRGNSYYDLYMHLGESPESVDLTPGATRGVLYDGMSADGSRVFFTTTDNLLPADDTDESADIYEAEVGPAGGSSLRLISVGQAGPSNDDSCIPPGTLESGVWNKPDAASEGADCSALVPAGGAGVAADGTLFFLSPELLDGGAGTFEQPNLYVVEPGAAGPRFVSTIDSSLVRPPKPLPGHPLLDGALITGQSGATGVAVDKAGSIYVLNNGSGRVRKYSSSGSVQNYTAGTNSGSNILTGVDAPTGAFSFEAGAPVQIAVDRENGYLYVPDYKHNVVDRFSTTGAYLSQVSVTQPTGVAVEPASGALYVASGAGAVQVFTSSGSPVATLAVGATAIAVGREGRLYGVLAGKVSAYDATSGAFIEDIVASGAKDVAVDTSGVYPYDGQLYVNRASQIAVFDSSGDPIQTFGTAEFTSSVGIAVAANHHAYASRLGTRVLEFGFSDPPYAAIESPAVLHAAGQVATRDTSDFQASADGRYAVFPTRMELGEYENRGHSEIYRYDVQQEQLDCVSCTPSGAITTTDTFLAPYGFNLTDDGRVFFTSSEPLVLRDTNGNKDAYEWSAGKVQLVSTGASSSDSGLLSVSVDGTDAFFFTRQVLVPADQNGGRMKVYDARAGGGFLTLPAQQPCKASDECHGEGSPIPPPPDIRTVTGAGPQQVPASQKPCRRGFHRRRGKCVKKGHAHHRNPHHGTVRHG